jgi:predicted transcriptional regulator
MGRPKGGGKDVKLRARIIMRREWGETYKEIQQELGCANATITAAIKEWRASHVPKEPTKEPSVFDSSGLPPSSAFSARAQECLKNGSIGNGNDTLYKMGEQIERLAQQLKALGAGSKTLGP